ncbi:MAG: transketolase [Bryobacteraceae bacterium]
MNATEIRRIILEQSKRANVGHIGSALSIADLIAALYGGVLRVEDPSDPDRDRFILSKGHASLALYAALYLRGWLSGQDLSAYCGNGSLLGVHPEAALRGVDFATGSLGQGLCIGTGCALAARLQHSDRRVYVLLSDAELNEGSVWEAALFAAHHRLHNLTAIVDVNGQQALGKTADVLDLAPLSAKWSSFGWVPMEVDGHDIPAIRSALLEAGTTDRPRVLLASTTFGKGVSYMCGQVKWHYWPMSDEEYAQAMSEIGCAR